MVRVLAVCAGLAGVAQAQTPSPEAPPPPQLTPNPALDPGAYQRLLDRQRQLEERVQAQDALLRTLQRTVALTGTEPPTSRGPGDPELSAPLAGYSNKNFFFRDRHSWFVLVPKGRINVDWYNFLNRPAPPPGVEPNSPSDPRASVRDGIFLRRARLGMAGTIARVIDFRVEADFASVLGPGQYAQLADASAVINVWPYVRLEAGQFYAPFTLENQTSENFTDFMEKSSVVRFAVPTSREIGGMLFGEAPRNVVRYWVGVFNGDGQNVKNADNRPAVIGRLVASPLAFLGRRGSWLEELWVGGSFWVQQADNLGGAGPPSTSAATAGDLPAFTTASGVPVFNTSYTNGTDLLNNPVRSHLAQNGNTIKYGFELNVPVRNRYGVRSEYVHQSIDLREYTDASVTGGLTRTAGPFAHLDGWGAYVEAYVWIGGDVNADHPGLYSIPHWTGYAPPKPPTWALQLAAKYEHVELDITNLPTAAGAMEKILYDPAAGHYALDTFALGANLWVTRHARLMANYYLNYLGAGDPTLSVGAGGAAANEKKNLFYQRLEHELLFRLQVNL